MTTALTGAKREEIDLGSDSRSYLKMGSRWYGPNEAQFLSRDSVFGMLQTPISLNRYTYAQGNPLMYMDPDGHAVCFIHGWANCKREAKKLAQRSGKFIQGLALGVQRNTARTTTAPTETRKTKEIQRQRNQHRQDSARKQELARTKEEVRKKTKLILQAPCNQVFTPANEEDTTASQCQRSAELEDAVKASDCLVTDLACVQLAMRNLKSEQSSGGGGGGKGDKGKAKGILAEGEKSGEGSFETIGKAKQTEIDYGKYLEAQGYKVIVRGTGAQGHDLIVDGAEYELKSLQSPSQTAVIRNVAQGLPQGKGKVVIDGRKAGLSPHDANVALERLKGAGRLKGATQIVIETSGGRIIWP